MRRQFKPRAGGYRNPRAWRRRRSLLPPIEPGGGVVTLIGLILKGVIGAAVLWAFIAFIFAATPGM
jgi:hypothetical protein